MLSGMIDISQPGIKSRVQVIKSFPPEPCEKLLPNGLKKSFYLSAPLRFVGAGMNQAFLLQQL
jgi:hypothetical protein